MHFRNGWYLIEYHKYNFAVILVVRSDERLLLVLDETDSGILSLVVPFSSHPASSILVSSVDIC